MAQIEVTNITEQPVTIREFYTPMRPGQRFTTMRSVEQIRGMTGLHEALAAKQVTVAITYTDAEKSSGLIPDLQ